VRLGHGETDGIANTLAERAGGDLHAGGLVGLGMAGGDAVDSLGGAVSENVRAGEMQRRPTRKAFRSSMETA
jgi:hypothetical protein